MSARGARAVGESWRRKSTLKTRRRGSRTTVRAIVRGESQKDCQGNCLMKLLDSGIRVFVLSQGTGMRWLRDELNSLKVNIPLSDGCVAELVRVADGAAWRLYGEGPSDRSYLTYFRQELVRQAAFVSRWTGSDEKLALEEESAAQFVRIARKYALPRPWKLSEPVAVESQRLRPSHWKWPSAFDPTPMAHGSVARV